MPINPIFGAIPRLGAQTLMDIIQQRTAQQEKVRGAEAQRRLIEAQTQQIPIQKALQAAQAKKIMLGIERPELNLAGLPQIARQRAYVNMLGERFGKDSPQYQDALADFQRELKSSEVAMTYKEMLTEQMPKRFVSPMGRALMEQKYLKEGLTPTGEIKEPLVQPKASGVPMGSSDMERQIAQMEPKEIVEKGKKFPTVSVD